MRYFAAFSRQTHINQPLPEEKEAETILYKTQYTKNEKMYMLVSKFSKNEITYEAFIEGMGKL